MKRPISVYPDVSAYLLKANGDLVVFKQRDLARMLNVGLLALWNALRHLAYVGAITPKRLKRGNGGGCTYQILDRSILEAKAKIPLTTGSPSESTSSQSTIVNGSKPRPWHITPDQLRSPEGIEKAYRSACEAGYLEASEAMWLWFAAVVAKGLRKANDLVRWVAAFVRRRLFKNVSCRDEDAGRKLVAPPQGKFDLPADERVANLIEMLVQRSHRPQVEVQRPVPHYHDERRAQNEREIKKLEQQARIARLIHEGREAAKARLA